MISIDFGNSYTKVSIRPGDNDDARPVKDTSLDFDEWNICIPTVAARRGKQWYYGIQVLGVSTAKDLVPYRNWKPLFFHERTQDSDVTSSVLQSHQELHRLGLGGDETTPDSDAQLTFLRRQVQKLQQENAALKAILRQRAPTDVDVLYKEIALGFFRWLRSFVAPIAKKYGIPDVSQHPVRIMLPNFGSHTSARGVLVDILSEAGWKPATQYSAMPEPLANVIGVSTAGRNRVWEPTPGDLNPNYNLMFRGAPLINAIRDFHLGRRAQPFYWMLAIDLGGYTTDFGMLGFDLDNYEDPISGVCEERKRLSTVSFAHGMLELDRMTGQVVAPDKAAHLAELLNDADQRRLETLHRRIYQRQGAYTTYSGLVFRDGTEAAAIDECISGFADDIVRRADEFLEANQYQEIDCVVLTGGGFYIPLIRDVVCRGLERYSPAGRRSVAHVPAPASENLPPHWRRMESEFVRGATAAGGASIWFDYAKDFGSEL